MKHMSTIGDERWTRASAIVAEATGLHFPPERHEDLRRGVAASARELGFDDADECVDRLGAVPLTGAQVRILASHLTVGETYFFRDRNAYDAFAEWVHVLRRGSRPRRLRIWSAACCTGEEAYSLAIALHQAVPDLSGWDATILATDINPHFLEKAAAGIYGEWSFRSGLPGIKARYFRRTADGRYALIPEIRAMVKFAQLNLVAYGAYPSPMTDTDAMDVIFCRNALMYFAPGPMRRVIDKLYDALVPGGWLAVSPSEASGALFKRFVPEKRCEALLYRKGIAQVDDVPAVPWSPLAPETPEAAHEPAGRGAAAAPSVVAVESYAERARTHANLGEHEQGLAWCDRWTAADTLDPAGHYLRAVILFEQARYDEARTALRRSLFLQPDFVLAHYTLGNLASRCGDEDGARRHYTNALHLLSRREVDDLIPEAEGLTAGRLAETIGAILTTADHHDA